MLIQAVIYGVLVTLTLVAVAEAIRTCCQDDKTKKTARVWSAPVRALKSKLKGMKTLKEETPARPLSLHVLARDKYLPGAGQPAAHFSVGCQQPRGACVCS